MTMSIYLTPAATADIIARNREHHAFLADKRRERAAHRMMLAVLASYENIPGRRPRQVHLLQASK